MMIKDLEEEIHAFIVFWKMNGNKSNLEYLKGFDEDICEVYEVIIVGI